MRVPDELYEEMVKALLEETEYPVLNLDSAKVTTCSTSKDGKKQFIYAKPKHVIKE